MAKMKHCKACGAYHTREQGFDYCAKCQVRRRALADKADAIAAAKASDDGMPEADIATPGTPNG